jgi:hypothetical protein
MASFQKRSDMWRAIVRRAGAKPVARTFQTKAAAREWAVRVEHEIAERGAKALHGRALRSPDRPPPPASTRYRSITSSSLPRAGRR